MRNQLERCILGVHVNVVIHLVGHLGHLLAGRHSLAADEQLGSVDINHFINPRGGAAEESLSDRTEERFVGSGEGILSRLIDVQYRAPRFQYAEVITLDREQRTGNNAFVCNLDSQALGSEHVRPIGENGCDNLPCDCHNLHSASAPEYAHRGSSILTSWGGNVSRLRRASVCCLFALLQFGFAQEVSFRIQPLHPIDELRVQALKEQPPREEGSFRKPELVELVKRDPTIKLDVRYATTNNFLGTPLYTQARAFLQRPAAEAVVRAGRELATHGYGLLVYDGYRPWYVTEVFWNATPDDKKIFVANPAEGSRHNRGCAVDISLYDLKTGKAEKMPSGYDEMTE